MVSHKNAQADSDYPDGGSLWGCPPAPQGSAWALQELPDEGSLWSDGWPCWTASLTVRTYDPDVWLVSMVRALQDYIVNNSSTVYDIQMSFPNTDLMEKHMPFEKTIIHFDIDGIDSMPLGMGDNVVDYSIIEIDTTVTDQEAHIYIVRFDVGIWASEQSGGTTARLEAKQDLARLFDGPSAQAGAFTYTEGVHILSFEGGRYFIDSINDLPIWRVGDMTLTTKVFSRRTPGPLLYPSTFEIDPGVEIDDTVIVS